MMSERALFLKAFMAHPREMGSITPSSRYLTRRMLQKLPWDSMKSVVELGAGTGVFTEQIVTYKAADCKFVAIEKNELLLRRLSVLYPDVLMGEDAQQLASILTGYHMGAVDCVISALPFALMAKSEREDVIAVISRSLNDGGTFIMYQYSLQMRRLLKRYFHHVHISLELRNFPPAFVYVCTK